MGKLLRECASPVPESASIPNSFEGVQCGQFTAVLLSTLKKESRPLAMHSTSRSLSHHVRPAVQQAVWSWREEVMRQPHCHPAELQRNLNPAEGMPRR